MSFSSKQLFRLSYTLTGRKEIKLYDESLQTSKLSYSELKNVQDRSIKNLIDFSYNNVKYYNNLFKSLRLKPSDIVNADDLNKLPLLTKSIIRENYNDMMPVKPYSKYFNCKTGGSTGQSLKYRCSDKCYSLGVALMYRGWGYAGYELGDSVFFFGGGSLIKDSLSFRAKMSYKSRNYHPYSSFGISKNDYFTVFEFIKKNQPKYFRGYASSLTLLAKAVAENGGVVKLGILPPKAIFTTADMLLPNQRTLIEKVFHCKVFNNYGLNDGGAGAYEDGVQEGFLVDPERAFVETVNSDLQTVFEESGTIAATSLYNYDFPFIRYDTGDLGTLSKEWIEHGDGNKVLLKNLEGRSSDFLKINNKTITSAGITVIMGKADIWKYQVVQNEERKIEIKIERGPDYTNSDEINIRNVFLSHFGDIQIVFNYNGDFIDSKNKHRFLIDLTKR